MKAIHTRAKHMRAVLLTSLLAGSVLLSGCVISIDDDYDDGYHISSGAQWERSEAKNREYIATANTGVSRASVVAELGAADFNEMVTNNGDSIQVLYYRTQRVDDDGVTTKNECTPLVFVNNTLVGWGDAALSTYF